MRLRDLVKRVGQLEERVRQHGVGHMFLRVPWDAEDVDAWVAERLETMRARGFRGSVTVFPEPAPTGDAWQERCERRYKPAAAAASSWSWRTERTPTDEG